MIELLKPWQAQDLSGWTRSGKEGAPTVHFLHGNGFSSTTLLPVGLGLPADWNLLFTDVPGHGLSVQPKGYMPDWLGMARKIGDALAARVSGPIIGVGHSMGGVMTLMIAAERPELFSRIVLLDPIFFTPEIIMLQRLARKTGLWRRNKLVVRTTSRRKHWPDQARMKADLARKGLYKSWRDDALQAFVEGGSKPAPEGGVELCCAPEWEASIFGSYPRGLWQAARTVQVPVHILLAEQSYDFIKRSAVRAQKANAKVEYQVVPGSHCFPMESPERVVEFLLNLPQ